MAVVVAGARLIQGQPMTPLSSAAWTAIALLAIFPTALARLLVFAGMRRLGGIQTSLLGIAELLVAVSLAFIFLGESFTPVQWVGAALFVASVLLISRDASVQMADEETWWRSLFPEPAHPTGASRRGGDPASPGP